MPRFPPAAVGHRQASGPWIVAPGFPSRVRARTIRVWGSRIHRRLKFPQGSSAACTQIEPVASDAAAGRPQHGCASDLRVQSSGVPPEIRSSCESQLGGWKVSIHQRLGITQRGGEPFPRHQSMSRASAPLCGCETQLRPRVRVVLSGPLPRVGVRTGQFLGLGSSRLSGRLRFPLTSAAAHGLIKPAAPAATAGRSSVAALLSPFRGAGETPTCKSCRREFL